MAEYIEREKVLQILSGRNAPWYGYNAVKILPTADVQPVKHGKWFLKDESMSFSCSNCHIPQWQITLFCPNCGAKMDG